MLSRAIGRSCVSVRTSSLSSAAPNPVAMATVRLRPADFCRGATLTEREDLKHRIDTVLEDLAIGMEGWRHDGLVPNSVLTEARELQEEAGWEKQPDLADRLGTAIAQAEREIELGRS
jgi:hypothetical protein